MPTPKKNLMDYSLRYRLLSRKLLMYTYVSYTSGAFTASAQEAEILSFRKDFYSYRRALRQSKNRKQELAVLDRTSTKLRYSEKNVSIEFLYEPTKAKRKGLT